MTESLGLRAPDYNDRGSLDEMVSTVIDKYKSHPGIKTSVRQGKKCRFFHIHTWNAKDELDALDPKESNSGSIPIKIMKDRGKIVVPYLTDCINTAINNSSCPNENTAINNSSFPNELNVADASNVIGKD